MKEQIMPKVTFIGAKETGKTTTIRSLWGKNNNTSHIHEFIDGRGEINYDVIELPYISFSIESEIDRWINNPDNYLILKDTDVLVFLISIDNITYSRKAKFVQQLRTNKVLKEDATIIIGLSQVESIVDIGIFHNEPILSLEECSHIMNVRDSFYKEFRRFICDIEFDMSNVIPFSYEFEWQFSELKEKVIEGVIKRHNKIVYDNSYPTIVFIGKTGCGKSSTINTLCGTELPVDGSVACTKYPIVINKEISYRSETKKVNIVDLPGIAESLDANLIYMDYYNMYLKSANVIVCLSQANTRAYKQDEDFYKEMIEGGIITNESKIILGINKIDLIFKSDEFLSGIDLSTVTDANPLIQDKINDYYDNVFSKIFFKINNVSRESIVVYSNLQNWNIEKLLNNIFLNI